MGLHIPTETRTEIFNFYIDKMVTESTETSRVQILDEATLVDQKIYSFSETRNWFTASNGVLSWEGGNITFTMSPGDQVTKVRWLGYIDNSSQELVAWTLSPQNIKNFPNGGTLTISQFILSIFVEGEEE